MERKVIFMKKSFGFLFLLVLMLGCVFLLTPEARAATEGDYTYTVSEGKATITKYSGSTSNENVTIPDTLGGYPVTAIGEMAFYGSTGITDVIVPDSVTHIDDYAFYGCTGLCSITFGENSQLTRIGGSTFNACKRLTAIQIPAGVTDIGKYAFYDCIQLSAATFEDESRLTTIGDCVFENCTELRSVTFGKNSRLTQIGWSAFGNCNRLTTIQIPDSVTDIGGYAFYRCSSLSAVPFGEGSKLTTIGGGAFYYCTGLTKVTIPDSVTVIWDDAFSCCKGLSAVTFGEGSKLTTIGKDAFFYCAGLTEVTIPDSVTTIDSRAFSDCENLARVNFGANSQLTDLGSSAFSGTGLKSIVIPKGVTVISTSLFSFCESLTSVTMPEGITEIGDMAFYSCGSISKLEIPNSVTKIGATVFWGCGVNYTTYENGKYLGNSKNPYLLLIGSNSTTVSAFKIHKDTKLIYSSAFNGCSALSEVTLPEGVVYIGRAAFYNCTGLTAVNIPEGVTQIEFNTFCNCSSLKTIRLPEKITAIGYSAFDGCSKLTAINIPEGVTSIGYDAFKNCSSLTSITIPGGVTHLGRDLLSGCSSLEELTFPYVLNEWWSLEDGDYIVEYPVGYLFGKSSYSGAIAVKQSYEYPISYEDSGDFYGYVDASYTYYLPGGLKTVTVNGGQINYGAFVNCIGLTDIILDDAITNIDGNAFGGCTSLKAISIPKGITAIKEFMFGGCTSLQEVTIPISVTRIFERAFGGCTSLEVVYYEGSQVQWDLITGSEQLDGVNVICMAQNEEEDTRLLDYIVCSVSNGKLTIVDCDETLSGDVVIPSVLGGYPVVAIGTSAFQDCTKLTSITIPASVTNIGAGAFRGCSSLTGIWVDEENPNYCSDSLGVLFNKGQTDLIAAPCSMTGFYTILDGTTAIGNYAFDGCEKLAGVFFMDESLKTIGGYAFRNCTALETMVLPCGVTALGQYAFYGCTGLTEITIPNGVTTIGGGAFSNCTGLTEITIPNGVTTIGGGAFSNCTGLTEITIPNGVTTIGSSAFSGCTGLTEIIVPDGVTNIGSNAFANCSNLRRLELPSSVSSLGASAFSGCRSLEHLTVPIASANYRSSSDVEGYWQRFVPFGYFFGTWQFEGSVKAYQYDYELRWDYDMGSWGGSRETRVSYYIPASLKSITFNGTSIPQYAFMYFTNITSVTIAKSVTKIGYYAFFNCQGIKDVYYEGTKGEWSRISIGKNNDRLTGATLHTVEPIATELTIVSLPNQTVYYQGKALDTTGLVLKAVMDNGETRTVTEGYTISGYDASIGGFQTVTVTYAGATVTFQVEVKVLYVTGIAVSRLPDQVEYWEGEALDVSGLVLTTQWTDGVERLISTGYTVSGYNPAAPGEQTITVTYEKVSTTFTVTVKTPYVTNVAIKRLPEKLEYWLFEQPDTTGLVLTVTWANGLVEDVTTGYTVSVESGLVGQQTATVTYGEESITYTVQVKKGGSCGESLTWILDDAGTLTVTGTGKMTDFANSQVVPWYQLRDDVKKVVIEKGVTRIGKYAFSYCGNLTEITIPSGVQEIGGYAFERTHNLTQVKLPAGLQTIEGYAFYRSEGLQGIVIPNSVTTLGASVFSRCINLSQVTLSAGITKLERYTFYMCGSLTEVTVPDSVTTMGDQVFEGCSGLTVVTLSRHLGAIGKKSFSGCTALKDVYYRNTADNWAQITIGDTNEPLFAATLHTHEAEMPLTITHQPKDALAQVGETVTFTVIAEGDGLTYKWQYKNANATTWNNTSLTGHKTNTLTLVNVQGSGYHGRQFRCIITDASGNTVTAEPATLTVQYLINDAKSQSAQIGQTATFKVNYSVSEGVTYRWEYKGNTATSTWASTSAAGNKTNTLTVTAKATNNRYMYRCKITVPGMEPFYSKEVYLNVVEDPAQITANPVDASAVCGDYATFSVEATGNGLSYQWQWSDDGVNWSITKSKGYNTNTIQVKTNNFINGRYYRCIIKTLNGSGTHRVYSEAATLTVLPAANIREALPETVTVKNGENAVLHIGADGEGLTYQWQWAKFLGNWKNTTMEGATTDTLTIPATADKNGRYYRVVITNTYGGYVETKYVQLIVE